MQVHNAFVASSAQRGSWLARLFRRAIRFIATRGRAVGKEALKAGLKIIDDVTEKKSSFKESVKSRLYESGRNL